MKDSLVEKVLGRKAVESFPGPNPDMSDEEKMARWSRVQDVMKMAGMRDLAEIVQYVKMDILDKLDEPGLDSLEIKRLAGQYKGLDGFYQAASIVENEGLNAKRAIQESNRTNKKPPEEELNLD